MPFWSTKDAGQKPFTFVIGRGNVIKTWDEGVLGAGRSLLARSLLSEPRNAGMTLGEQAKITATPDYAYGAGGFPAWGIMPNRRDTNGAASLGKSNVWHILSTLIFDIEVLKIE